MDLPVSSLVGFQPGNCGDTVTVLAVTEVSPESMKTGHREGQLAGTGIAPQGGIGKKIPASGIFGVQGLMFLEHLLQRLAIGETGDGSGLLTDEGPHQTAANQLVT
jgi:hypothetical protein